MSMLCPTCGKPTRVIDSRPADSPEAAYLVKRRYHCTNKRCKVPAWSTVEMLADRDFKPSENSRRRLLQPANQDERAREVVEGICLMFEATLKIARRSIK